MDKILRTKNDTFLLRPYQAGDEEGILRLWEKAFGKEMSHETWRWKYADNPYGHYIMLGLTEGGAGEVVTMYSGIPYLATLDGQTIRMTHNMDIMGHPGFRAPIHGRRSLFVETGSYFKQNFENDQYSPFNYGFTGLKSRGLSKIYFNSFDLLQGGFYLELSESTLPKNKPFRIGTVEMLTRADEHLDAYWENLKHHYPFAVKRNRQFFQWRFWNHPNHTYEVYVFRNWRKKITAHIVFLRQADSLKLVDVMTLPGSSGLSKNISAVRTEKLPGSAKKMAAWLPLNRLPSAHLQDAGFKPAVEPIGFFPTGMTCKSELNASYTNRTIYFTMADGDLL